MPNWILLAAGTLLLAGCSEPLSEHECDQLLDHYTEHLLRNERAAPTRQLIAQKQAAARALAHADKAFEFDTRRSGSAVGSRRGRSGIGLVLHHLIGDFFSFHILLSDLVAAYDSLMRGHLLNPRPAAYREWVAKQRHQLTGEAGTTSSRLYWHKQLAGELPTLQLPLDRPRRLPCRLLMAQPMFRAMVKKP